MLNPHGYATAAKKPADSELSGMMKSVKTNLTDQESQVEEFIKKETNQQRRKGLEEIFKLGKKLKSQFDNHRQCDLEKSAVYKEMASELYQLMQKQRHAGRKLFMTCVSNPLLGFDSTNFFYYPTIRGVKSSQLEMMDGFITNLKGIKTEFDPDIKPFTIGMMNVPKSESSRESRKSAGNKNVKNNRKIQIRHADLKNDLAASISSVIMSHNVPIKWLDHNIDTSEIPNAFKRKANILINCSLVVEMTDEPLKITIPDTDYDWSSNGSFEIEANKIIDASRNSSTSKKVHNEPMEVQYFNNIISDSSADLAPENAVDSGIGIRPAVASTPINKKNESRILPKPSDSLLSSGLPEDILNLEQIRTKPLATPKIKRQSFGRSNTIEPSRMMPLVSDSDSDDIPLNVSAPTPGTATKIASQKDLDIMLQQINDKFEQLEKSINKN